MGLQAAADHDFSFHLVGQLACPLFGRSLDVLQLAGPAAWFGIMQGLLAINWTLHFSWRACPLHHAATSVPAGRKNVAGASFYDDFLPGSAPITANHEYMLLRPSVEPVFFDPELGSRSLSCQ
jgi:hypothetical protein